VPRRYGSADTGVLVLAAKYCLLAADLIKCLLISNFLYLDIYSFDLKEVNDIQALRTGSGMCQHWGLHCIMPYKAVSQPDVVLYTRYMLGQTTILFLIFFSVKYFNANNLNASWR